MEIKFLRNGKKSLKRSIKDIENCKIQDIKSKLEYKKRIFFGRRRIFIRYMILENNGVILKDDTLLSSYGLPNKCRFHLKIMISWRLESQKNVNTIYMEYNASFQNLLEKLRKELNDPDIQIKYQNKKKKKEKKMKYLRYYLRYDEDQVFIVNSKKITKDTSENITLNIKNNYEEESEQHLTRINIDPKCDVQELRRIIANELKIDFCNIDINFKDMVLLKGDLLHYKIKDNDILTVKKSNCPRFTGEQFVINVRKKDDKEMKYLIDDLETVGALKVILREQYNVNVRCISLSHNGKELRNDDIIRALNIENGATFLLTLEEKEVKNNDELRIKIVNGLKEKYGENEGELTVSANETIKVLRQRIEGLLPGLSQAEYVISYLGEIMKSENVINTYNIGDGDEVLVSGSLIVRYFVAGDNASAKVSRYAFLAQDTVGKLKMKITKKLNLDAQYIHLTFDGNMLEDHMVLDEIGVENESYLMMISSLAGGYRL